MMRWKYTKLIDARQDYEASLGFAEATLIFDDHNLNYMITNHLPLIDRYSRNLVVAKDDWTIWIDAPSKNVLPEQWRYGQNQ